MTGAGAPGAPGIISCLLQAGWVNLIVGDCDGAAVGRLLHHQFVQLPQATDDNFIPAVLQICKERNIHVVLPLVTKELLPFANAKQIFADVGIKVLVSAVDAVTIANNKSGCYQFLQKKNVAVPAFVVVSTVEEFAQAAASLGYPQNG